MQWEMGKKYEMHLTAGNFKTCMQVTLMSVIVSFTQGE